MVTLPEELWLARKPTRSSSRNQNLVPPFNAASFVYNRAVHKSAQHTPKPRWTTSWPGRIGCCF